MTLLGQFALWAAFLLSLWTAAVGFSGAWRTRPDLARSVGRGVTGILVALLVASAALWYGIVTHDFNIEYVAGYTSRNLPGPYLISAFWAGQKGSLLLWATVLAVYAVLAQALTPRRHSLLLPYVAAVTSTTAAFFIAVMLFGDSPFARLPFTPPDGRGLNPQLQNVGMVMHPPMLYLGYIGITIPFAFAMAALLARRFDTGWLIAARKWTLVSWLFLSIGIVLGMWWAYVELGWGGYWAWDPVENASFLPWLVMTAFLHSVMIQEKRGMLKRWNVALIVGAFLLSIFGTFITRSGVIASVHSFAQSGVGYYFLAFLVGAGVLAFTLLWSRWPALEPEARLESSVSRESAFLFNNLLLVGVAFSVLWGTLFPILSEWLAGTKVTVGPPFFNRVNVPLGLLLLGLTGVGPLIAWRRATAENLQRQFAASAIVGLAAGAGLVAAGMRDAYVIVALTLAAFTAGTIIQEFWRGVRARQRMHGEAAPLALVRVVGRNRRRYGGYIVHAGVVLMFAAWTGMAFRVDQEATLRPGASAEVESPYGHRYTFTHLGVSQYKAQNRIVSAATVQVARDGKPAGRMTSEKRQHVDSFNRPTFEPSTEVAIRSGLREDVYIVYAGSVNGTEEAVYRFTINPLVWWVWFAGGLLVLGGLVTMWPGASTPAERKTAQAGYAVRLAEPVAR